MGNILLICEKMEIMIKYKFTKESFIGILIGLISLINLYNNLNNPLHFSNIISIVGLIGVYFLLREKANYKKLIYIWIVSQIIIIDRIVLDKTTGEWHSTNFLDFSQAFNIEFGMQLNYTVNKFGLSLNIVPFFYLIIYKILEVKSIINKSITFYQLEANENLKSAFPIEGTIMKVLKIANEKDWFLITLNNPIIFGEKSTINILIKNQKFGVIKLKSNYQPVYCRLILNEGDLETKSNDIENFPLIGLLTCE